MMMDIVKSVNECCERLLVQKELVTSSKVQNELLQVGEWEQNQLQAQSHKIPKLISKWRLLKLKTKQKIINNCPSEVQAATVQSVTANNSSKDRQAETEELVKLRRKVFLLEKELNRHKYSAVRTNNKIKFLEKKLHSFKNKITKERLYVIGNIKEMLG